MCQSTFRQHYVTYRFYDINHIWLQGFKERIRIKGANQFWNIPDIEFANANLLSLPDGYYLAITTYQNKGGETKKYKPEIGIDMGIKTTLTTSEGQKDKVLIGESERIKKCQRLLARRKKGSSNCAGAPVPGSDKARKLLHRAYQKLTSRKRDTANKIVHELLEHEHVYMQDENLKGGHKGLFGRTVQHREDRDINAARNMILLAKGNTCGTQEINAFGEDVRRKQECCNADLVELGSSRFYKRG